MSPVWIMNDGFFGIALILLMASSSVPIAFGLAGLSKPTWLSLICRNVIPAGSAASAEFDNAERARHAAGDGPEHAGAGPGHAFQDAASADTVLVVVVIAHGKSP